MGVADGMVVAVKVAVNVAVGVKVGVFVGTAVAVAVSVGVEVLVALGVKDGTNKNPLPRLTESTAPPANRTSRRNRMIPVISTTADGLFFMMMLLLFKLLFEDPAQDSHCDRIGRVHAKIRQCSGTEILSLAHRGI